MKKIVQIKNRKRNPGNEEHDCRIFQAGNEPTFTHLACDKAGEEPLKHRRVGEEPLVEEHINDPAETPWHRLRWPWHRLWPSLVRNDDTRMAITKRKTANATSTMTT